VNARAADGSPPIYTKTGDDGITGLLFGGRVSKADLVVEVCGALDEAVAALGLGRSLLADDQLEQIVLDLQRGLFTAAAELAANPRARDRLLPGISSVTPEMTASLERAIDAILAEHPLRPAFVVPGATPASAALDLARTFLRRAERRLIAGREGGLPVSATLTNRICEPRLGPRLRGGPPRGRRARGAAQPRVTRPQLAGQPPRSGGTDGSVSLRSRETSGLTDWKERP
jgi:cob(I)alamin adenosyltransferase